MPITKVDDVIIETAPKGADMFQRSGAMPASQYAIVDDGDHLKQLKFDLSGIATDTTVTITPQTLLTGRSGSVALVDGVAVVADATILSADKFVISPQGVGAGLISVSIINATSFTFTSSDIADTRTVAYIIL